MDSVTQKPDAGLEFLTWLEVNKKRVAIGGGVVLVAFGLLLTLNWYKKHHELEASKALTAVRVSLTGAEPVTDETIAQLRKVIADYSGTEAATRAELVLAGALYIQGKYAEAQTAFEAFSRNHPESPWHSQAFYGVAVCLDALGKTNEAIAKYEDFVRRFQTDANVDQARLQLASLLEVVGKQAEAFKEYDKILKAQAYSPAYGEAQERHRRLLAANPFLAVSNAPVAPPKPASVTNAVSNVVAAVRTNLPATTNRPAAPAATNSRPAVPATNSPAPK